MTTTLNAPKKKSPCTEKLEYLEDHGMTAESFAAEIHSNPRRAADRLSIYAETNFGTKAGDWALRAIEKIKTLSESVKAAIEAPNVEAPADIEEMESEETFTESEELPAPPAEILPYVAPVEQKKAVPVQDVEFDTDQTEKVKEEKTVEPDWNGKLGKVVGQKIAVERLKAAVISALTERDVPSYLIKGEPGLGKTAIANALLSDLGKAGWEVMTISDPKEIRLKGTAWTNLMDALLDGSRKVAVYIDECHGLTQGITIQLAKVKAMLMKFMDGNNKGKYIKLDDESGFTVDYSRLCFVLSTNFPDKLDPSGAFQSRCQVIELDHYSETELVDILQTMLARFGFRPADDKTLSIIAQCGRGTARPMEKIVQELKTFVTKETINKDDVKKALRLTKLYPDGFNASEIALMQRISQPMKDNVLLAAFPNMESTSLRRAKGYMMTKGYCSQLASGFQRTDKGTRYLKAVKEAGFTV